MRMPFFIELEGKRVLIIGGGEEGVKRAEKYVRAGAEITVLSRGFDRRLLDLASRNSQIKLVKGNAGDRLLLENLVRESDIIMVALETKEYNRAIEEMTRRYKRPLNLANDAEATEVIVPIDGRAGAFRVAVTTEGKSSMAAREALKKILEALKHDTELQNLAEFMYKVKKILKKSEPSIKRRMELYRRIFNDGEFREAAKKGDEETAIRRAQEIIYNTVL